MSSTHATALDVSERIAVVERSMEVYDRRLDGRKIVEQSGRHLPAVEKAVEKTVEWGRDAESYLEAVFEAGADATDGDSEHTFAVLPRNDRGDLAPYVLSQCLLAGAEYTVRPSSREASEYVARTYHESVLEAVSDVIGGDRADAIAERLELIEPTGASNAEKMDEIANACPDRCQLVLFGSDDTLQLITAELGQRGVQVSDTVQMGTGRSSSIIAAVNNENIKPYCREIAESAVFDKGDDCTSTNVLYVVGDSDFYLDVRRALVEVRSELTEGEDFASPAEPELEAARRLVRDEHPGNGISDDLLNVVECTMTEPVSEYPVPMLQIKSVADQKELRETLERDFAEEPSLAASIYTDNSVAFERIGPDVPATLVKHNQPTHDIDLLEPHQGVYLVAELVS